MKYTSLQEYFYKLQNILYALILLPLVGFILLLTGVVPKFGVDPESTNLIIGILTFVTTMDWLIADFYIRASVSKISKMSALSEKLDGYFKYTTIRFAVTTSSCLLLVIGYYLTEHLFFVGLFAVALLIIFLYWPRPSKVCHDLKLKGDEREMVLYKKNSF